MFTIINRSIIYFCSTILVFINIFLLKLNKIDQHLLYLDFLNRKYDFCSILNIFVGYCHGLDFSIYGKGKFSLKINIAGPGYDHAWLQGGSPPTPPCRRA